MATLSRRDFDCNSVRFAQNPSPCGYHFGPIIDPYREWRAHVSMQDLKTEENNKSPRAAVLSQINCFICWIDVESGTMCGKTFDNHLSYYHHLETQHFGAVICPVGKLIRPTEWLAGQNALKRFVLERGWRYALFLNEPGTAAAESILTTYATACERIAAEDSEFANLYGTRFHRDVPDAAPVFGDGNIPRPKRSQPLTELPTTSIKTETRHREGGDNPHVTSPALPHLLSRIPPSYPPPSIVPAQVGTQSGAGVLAPKRQRVEDKEAPEYTRSGKRSKRRHKRR